jgi:hypothetical protein
MNGSHRHGDARPGVVVTPRSESRTFGAGPTRFKVAARPGRFHTPLWILASTSSPAEGQLSAARTVMHARGPGVTGATSTTLESDVTELVGLRDAGDCAQVQQRMAELVTARLGQVQSKLDGLLSEQAVARWGGAPGGVASIAHSIALTQAAARFHGNPHGALG